MPAGFYQTMSAALPPELAGHILPSDKIGA
jgi:hypothetical protein